jgi:hypothetical protein
LLGGDVGKACDGMIECAQIKFVNDANDLLLEGFVGGVIFEEERVIFEEERFQLVVILAKVGNLGACESVGYCGGRAWIDVS